ncbi:hypothetical protein D3C76_1364180 [compost metagenome]
MRPVEALVWIGFTRVVVLNPLIRLISAFCSRPDTALYTALFGLVGHLAPVLLCNELFPWIAGSLKRSPLPFSNLGFNKLWSRLVGTAVRGLRAVL